MTMRLSLKVDILSSQIKLTHERTVILRALIFEGSLP